VANLNLAKAADVEIAVQLNEINQAANSTLEKIDKANARIDEADAVLSRTTEELEQSGSRQREIESDLRLKAVEGFKNRSLGEVTPILTDMDVTRALRQHSLLAQASLSTAELLEELRGLLEERRLANAEAAAAKSEAEAAQQVLEEELALLKEQQATQLALKAEAERRIDIWAGELTAYAREDAAIQRVIVQNTQKAEVTTAVNNPTTASISGFQWPLSARVTSEYGYRVHPVYGSRRLHAGIDIAAPSGTPIAASNNGVIIFAGRQGGYGNTIIVDHGGGITTLYAHQSRLGASAGQAVDRGDIIGFVGATGTATGNHLHFEVRVNGAPTNPRNYLP
jgi:murein DD-endopeptidase MepM/ murein hydrolase activator NlpD